MVPLPEARTPTRTRLTLVPYREALPVVAIGTDSCFARDVARPGSSDLDEMGT
jgi:hypothetical protein